jgi:hypothetical protein
LGSHCYDTRRTTGQHGEASVSIVRPTRKSADGEPWVPLQQPDRILSSRLHNWWCSVYGLRFRQIWSHSRMPLVSTPARLKLLHVCDQWHSSRAFTPLTGCHCKLRPNTEGAADAPLDSFSTCCGGGEEAFFDAVGPFVPPSSQFDRGADVADGVSASMFVRCALLDRISRSRMLHWIPRMTNAIPLGSPLLLSCHHKSCRNAAGAIPAVQHTLTGLW